MVHPGQPDRRRQRRPVRHDIGGGANEDGTVFEIAKTATGYASTPTTLVSFNGADGGVPAGSLIADANGDLFGTTHAAARTATARCSRSPRPPPATPARRPRWSASTAPTERSPEASLIADANGDLFGMTNQGGADGDGTVFEIVKTAHRLRQHADHAGQLQWRRWCDPCQRLDRRRQRRPVRHDVQRRRVRRRHGVRDRQDAPKATPARRPRWSASTVTTAHFLLAA